MDNVSKRATDTEEAAPGSKRAVEADILTEKHKDEKFYAVRKGHQPGIYRSYPECLNQVRGFSNSQFKAYPSLAEAEAFMRDGPQAASRFVVKISKFYGVRQGWTTGVFTDWPAAQNQINGFPKAQYKSFSTCAEAELYVNNQRTSGGDEAQAAPSVKRQKLDFNEIDESVEPGSGPMPPISEDGFDARILLQPGTGRLVYKDEVQRSATKMQSVGMLDGVPIRIYTDGSSLSNGRDTAIAGVGVYFGPLDARNISEPLKGSRQTNQRAELTAIQRAVELAPRDRHIVIVSDSNYAIKCVTEWFQNWRANGWKNAQKKSVENRDLIEIILSRLEERERLGAKTKFEKVKGHADNPNNIAADSLAVAAATNARSATKD